MKDIFTSKVNPEVRPNNLIVKRHNTAKYGTKNLYNFSSANMEYLSENNESETCCSKFKKYINTWFLPQPQCICSYCKNFIK